MQYIVPIEIFDINQINSVKLLTTDEILIINCIASVLRKQGKTMQAIMWQKFLKEYLEHSNADYDEICKYISAYII